MRGFVQFGRPRAEVRGSARVGGGGSHALAPREQGVQLVESEAPSLSPGTNRGRPRGHALSKFGTPTPPHASPPLGKGGRACAPRLGSVRGHLVLGQQLAAAVDVAEDLLLELRHLLTQQARGGRQLRVLALECLHFLLEARDAL